MFELALNIARRVLPLPLKRELKPLYLHFYALFYGHLYKIQTRRLKKIDRPLAQLDNKNSLVGKKTIALDKRNETISLLRETLNKKNQSIKKITNFNPVIRSLKYAEYCKENENDLKADIYVAHDVLPLLAASVLSYRNGGRIFCNVIEIPSFRNRAAKLNWQDEVFSLIESSSVGNLRNCNLLITIGPTLGDKISDLGPPFWVLENYRYKEELIPSNKLRQMCGGLNKQCHLVLSISTVVTGFEDVLKAFALLPEEYHLATVGKFFPKNYEKTIVDLVQSLGLEKRIHFFDFVPYEQLTSLASSADLGLIIRDPKIVNNYVSLPNRVFDYISSGLPFCTPQIPDIVNIINTFNIGTVVEEMTPEGWASAIENSFKNVDEMKKNALDLASKLTWESKEPEIIEKFSPASVVTFLGMGDLTKNNRTKRMALTLAKSGLRIKICAVSKENPAPEHENISYHLIPNLFL